MQYYSISINGDHQYFFGFLRFVVSTGEGELVLLELVNVQKHRGLGLLEPRLFHRHAQRALVVTPSRVCPPAGCSRSSSLHRKRCLY